MASATAAFHGDPIAPVILGVTSILAFAVIGRVGARKLGQPTVLGELLMGILLGPATVRVLAKVMSRLDIVETKMFTRTCSS